MVIHIQFTWSYIYSSHGHTYIVHMAIHIDAQFPKALRTAKTQQSFGRSECNRINRSLQVYISFGDLMGMSGDRKSVSKNQCSHH